ncbi:hypothetical protein FACS189426_23620 [Bacteroidia bacterium]|nr:hypothetical protein FACS189426_23620 [Bacteroidia bacterium]
MKTADIQKLVEYIILNAYSVKSIGLYNGKVDLSLCLFEVTRHLNDESVEGIANIKKIYEYDMFIPRT